MLNTKVTGVLLATCTAISLLSSGSTYALEADLFVQPPGSVPIPALADSLGRLVVQGAGGVPSATTNKSTSVLTGGSFQQIAGASGTRKSMEFTNTCNVAANCVSTGDICYLYFASDNTPLLIEAIVIPPTATYLRSVGSVPQEAVYATCDGTGDTFRYVEQ